MAAQLHTLKVGKLADSSRFEYGPMAFYHPLIADGDTPVRTGIQTSAPGYVTPMHWHPYVELLFIIEGEADVWLQGAGDDFNKSGFARAIFSDQRVNFAGL